MGSDRRLADRSVDYERHGRGYAVRRRPDPRIAARIHAALGDAKTVVNVGAGTGSYEPEDRYVLAVEPSAVMRAQRPAHLAPAISGSAESLLLDDQSVDAAMAVLTVHHWSDQAKGLRELRRVARGPVVVLTFDIDAKKTHWLQAEYLPEVIEDDQRCFTAVESLSRLLGGHVTVEPVPIPADCTDGFFEAYWATPEAYLDEAVRAAQSAWARLPDGVEHRGLRALETDLKSGAWDQRHSDLRQRTSHDAGLVVITSVPE